MREVVQSRLWRGNSVALAEFDENSMVLGCTEFIAGKSKMRDPFGRLQSSKRPCVELIIEQVTEWVIAKPGALDREILQRLRYESFGSVCGCVEGDDGPWLKLTLYMSVHGRSIPDHVAIVQCSKCRAGPRPERSWSCRKLWRGP